jgi:hypothetical protein
VNVFENYKKCKIVSCGKGRYKYEFGKLGLKGKIEDVMEFFSSKYLEILQLHFKPSQVIESSSFS